MILVISGALSDFFICDRDRAQSCVIDNFGDGFYDKYRRELNKETQ